MTKEDAIKTLKELRRETNDPWYEEVYDMAINAFEADSRTGPQTMSIKKTMTGTHRERIEYTEAEMAVEDEPQTEEDYPKNCPYKCDWDE